MSNPARKLLTVDEFLAAYEGREGFWELWDGVPVERDGGPTAISPERVVHLSAKLEAAVALREAVRSAGLGCKVLPDGATVRIRANRAFVPDALVVCPPPPAHAMEIDNPVVVVEVVSPASLSVDHGEKLEGYFSLPSVQHYLILDPDKRTVIHHSRGADFIATRILHEGRLRLEPPGLTVEVEELFGSAATS